MIQVRITFQPQTSTDIDASLQEINVQIKDLCGPEEPEKMSSYPVLGPTLIINHQISTSRHSSSISHFF